MSYDKRSCVYHFAVDAMQQAAKKQTEKEEGAATTLPFDYAYLNACFKEPLVAYKDRETRKHLMV